MNTTLDRLPPHSIEAEQGVLGCCLADPKECLGPAIERLRRLQAFYDLRHQKVFELLMRMFDQNEAIDLITVQQRLKDAADLEMIGGIAYLSSLLDAIPSAANLESYLEIVRNKYLLRLAIQACTSGVARACECEGDPAPVLDGIERDLLGLNQERVSARETGIKEIIHRTIDQIEDYTRGHAQLRGLTTGFDYLDKMTCGMAPGQLIVYAARPGMGKTSFGMNLAEHVAVKLNLPVAVFSLEMTSEELGARLMFQHAQADFQRFRTGYLLNEDVPKLSASAVAIAKSPMWVDDSGDMNVMELRAKARRLKNQHDIRLVLIDYLQLIRGNNRYTNREAEVADISRALKALAKELNIPVLVLAQLNRELEKERNRLPRLSDLRESGSIEQDADMVGMFYEPRLDDDEAENSDWSQHSRRVNLLIAKQRNGPTGNVELLFHKASMRFHPFVKSRHTPPVPESNGKRKSWRNDEED